jgi:hypothetical protein
VNGESSVHVDRGRWLYRFALDDDNIAIYRARRAGQSFAPSEIWRCLAVVGVTDAFVVQVPDGWQPFVELGEGRQRWALERRASREEAEEATKHFLATLADAVAHASQPRGPSGEKETEAKLPRLPDPPASPSEAPDVEAVLARAQSAREGAGWELIYSRQRVCR